MTAPLDIAQRRRLLHLATTASVVTAALLILAKLVAWLMTGAVSVLASLVDSLMDAMASLVNLFAVRYSLQPADAEHRYGHGKAEALAGLGQAAFIAGSALFLVLESIDRLLHPKPLTALAVGIAVILFAMLATVLLVAIQRHVIRRTGSTAIKADSLHYLTDLITNASILVALILGAMGWPGLDPWFALGIAAYILYSAWHIGREAVQLLMDRELPPEVRQRIVELAYAPPQVRGVHDLRTRQSGHTYFIQLHLELDDHLPLREAHAIADGVEESVRRAFPGAEVLIHQDPVGGVRREHVRSEPRPAG
ncbi:MAG: ferrous iron transporter [Pseudomonadota bacterium]